MEEEIYYLKYKKYYKKYINLKNKISLNKIIGGGERIKITLEKVKLEHSKYLLPIVSDINIMKYIKKGKIWSEKELNERLKWYERHWKNIKNSKYFYWVIKVKSEYLEETKLPISEDGYIYIGLIGFHKSNELKKYDSKLNNNFYLTIFLDTSVHGKGIGSIALKKSISKMNKLLPKLDSVYSLAVDYNMGSQKISEKVGFKKINDNIKINNNNYILYQYKF